MNYFLLPFFLLWYLVNTNLFAAKGFHLESSAFQNNTLIPSQYTCNGMNISPPLFWHNTPTTAKSLALIVAEPYTAQGRWTHWVLFNIPPQINHLDAESAVPENAVLGKNSWNNWSYQGPCPNLGAHAYTFTLYALDKVLDLDNTAPIDKILDTLTGHVIASTKLTGLYQK